MLGGGLLPGTLTVVLGATGIGKTQLGLQFTQQGIADEGERGIIFDLTSRGDTQNHIDYAERMFSEQLRRRSGEDDVSLDALWFAENTRTDYMHVFQRSGRRVTKSDLDPEEWKEWKVELNRRLDRAIAFFYGNFVHGVRRCVIDGVEPTDRASDSFQLELFEYVYHQILHKEHDWVARDLFRVHYRKNEEQIAKHAYDHSQIGCVLLLTSHETMLDALIERPIESGDVLSNANTIILMGKTRNGSRMGRALHIAKHRGSACDDSIVPYEIGNHGLVIE